MIGLEEADVHAATALFGLLMRQNPLENTRTLVNSIISKKHHLLNQSSESNNTNELVDSIFEFVRICDNLLRSDSPFSVQMKQGLNAIVVLIHGDIPKFINIASSIFGDIKAPPQVSELLDILKKFGIIHLQSSSKSDTTLEHDNIDESCTTNFSQLFLEADLDSSGVLDSAEFMELTRKMGLRLSKQHAMRIFAQADTNGSGFIDYTEFDMAIKLLREETTQSTLSKLRVDSETLIMLFFAIMIYLVGFLLFLFLGIGAFTTGTTFAAIVNSIMPMLAGLSLSRSGEESNLIDQNDSKIEKITKRMLKDISNDSN